MLTGCILGYIELAVLRGCCASQPDLIDYVNVVIAQAVGDRRNCRVGNGYLHVYILNLLLLYIA